MGGREDEQAEGALGILLALGDIEGRGAGGGYRKGPVQAAPYMTVVTSREAGQKAESLRLLDPPLVSHRVGESAPRSRKS